MNREELLEFIKGKISEIDYTVLFIWTKYRERKGFLKQKTLFDAETTVDHQGYIIQTYLDGTREWIIVK